MSREYQFYDFKLTDIDGYEDTAVIISSYIIAKSINDKSVIAYCGNGKNGLEAITYNQVVKATA